MLVERRRERERKRERESWRNESFGRQWKKSFRVSIIKETGRRFEERKEETERKGKEK